MRRSDREHVHFFVVEAACGFVEQQDLRIGRSARASSTRFLGPERQAGNRAVRDLFEVEITEDIVDPRIGCRFAAANPGQLEAVADDVAVGARMVPTRTLSSTERLANSATFWNVRRCRFQRSGGAGRFRMVRPSMRMSPALRLVEPAQAIEQGGLAGAIRPDQARIWPRRMSKDMPFKATMPPEHNADIANREQGIWFLDATADRHLAAPPAGHSGHCHMTVAVPARNHIPCSRFAMSALCSEASSP